MYRRLAELLRLEGAVAVGFAKAGEVDAREWRRFEEWLSAGYCAGMDYMKRHRDLRRDPRLLLPDARFVVSIAFNYRQPNPWKGVATYALGQDYHKVLRKRLKRVVRSMREEAGGNWRICIDSAPVLERYWALKSGIGIRSKLNGNVVVPGYGSMVFLAELLTDLDLGEECLPAVGYPGDETDGDVSNRVCPTGALLSDGCIDARRCINYLTIEHPEELTGEQHKMVGPALFGCDICQLAASSNRGEYREIIPEFRPLAELPEIVSRLGEGRFSEIPSVSPISRKGKILN